MQSEDIDCILVVDAVASGKAVRGAGYLSADRCEDPGRIWLPLEMMASTAVRLIHAGAKALLDHAI